MPSYLIEQTLISPIEASYENVCVCVCVGGGGGGVSVCLCIEGGGHLPEKQSSMAALKKMGEGITFLSSEHYTNILTSKRHGGDI